MRSVLRIICLVVVSTLFAPVTAQEIDTPGTVLRGYAGLILNKSYSNISEKEEYIDDYSVIKRTPSDSAPSVKVGFIVGMEGLLGKKDAFKGVFGFALARSAAHYHSSLTEVSPTTRLGYTQMNRATELDYIESYFYADFLAGIRNRLFEHVYLTSAFAFSKPMITKRETNGYILTTYSTPGSQDSESTIAYVSDPEKKVKGNANLSLRFRLEYEFKLAEKNASGFVFRNVGLIYTLPWWGLGMAMVF